MSDDAFEIDAQMHAAMLRRYGDAYVKAHQAEEAASHKWWKAERKRLARLALAVVVFAAMAVALTGCQKFDPQDGAELWFGINVGALFVLALVFAFGGMFMLHTDRVALRLFFVGAFALGCFALLTACGDTINPVRYQPVEVLVTKPCLAGRSPPAQAVLLTDPVCTLPPAECVRAAAADIAELQREARESRNLIRECSK